MQSARIPGRVNRSESPGGISKTYKQFLMSPVPTNSSAFSEISMAPMADPEGSLVFGGSTKKAFTMRVSKTIRIEQSFFFTKNTPKAPSSFFEATRHQRSPRDSSCLRKSMYAFWLLNNLGS